MVFSLVKTALVLQYSVQAEVPKTREDKHTKKDCSGMKAFITCCSVTQLGPHGLQNARLPCLLYLLRFAQIHVL